MESPEMNNSRRIRKTTRTIQSIRNCLSKSKSEDRTKGQNHTQQLYPFPEKTCFLASLQFLGCGMEALRSKIAHLEPEKYKWSPDISQLLENCNSTLAEDCNSTQTKYQHRFSMSTDLKQCVIANKGQINFSLKMRLLYELQKFMLDNFDHNISFFSIVLCLLFFPTIHIQECTQSDLEAEIRRDGVGVNMRKEEKCFTIEPVMSPQNFKVIVRLSLSDEKVSFSLDRGHGQEDSIFLWEAWRNSFLGRINGAERWEEECQPERNISTPFAGHNTNLEDGKGKTRSFNFLGYKVTLWPMWMPHKCSICGYELKKLGEDNKEREQNMVMDKTNDGRFDLRVLTLKAALDYYEKNVSRAGNVPDSTKRMNLRILRERTMGLKYEKKFHLAAELFFQAAMDHNCTISLEDCVLILNNRGDYKQSAERIQSFVESNITNIDSGKGFQVLRMLKGILKDSAYAIYPVHVYSKIAKDFPYPNHRKGRDLQDGARRSLILSLRNGPHEEEEDVDQALGVLGDLLTDSTSIEKPLSKHIQHIKYIKHKPKID